MDKTTSVKYTITEKNNTQVKEMEYTDYLKNQNNETMLYYKKIHNEDGCIETFNKLQKKNNETNEVIGNSENKTEWDIKAYKNSQIHGEYKTGYNELQFNLNINNLINNDIDKIFLNNNKFIEDV